MGEMSRLCSAIVLSAALASPVLASDTSRVFVYRYREFTGGGHSPSVYCDGVESARLENGRWFVLTLPPGKHSFDLRSKQQPPFDVETESGQDYFFRLDYGAGKLVPVSFEQGSSEIQKYKQLDPVKVRDYSRVAPQGYALTFIRPPTSSSPSSPAQPSPQTDNPPEVQPLKNSDVVALKTAGMGDEVIIAKIKSSATHFSLSTDDLIQLKKAEVSETVIKAMIEAGKH